MPVIEYVRRRFNKSSETVITQANEIIAEYLQMGFQLTLRQLYYQFVSRNLIRNTEKSYKRLGSIISDARVAGRIDWNAIEDRGRNLRANSHWDSPEDIIGVCSGSFQYDKWADQPNRVEVWVEKDALVGVLEQACGPLDVSYFATRGYCSQSELWRSAQRMKRYLSYGQKCTVFYLGDHDPSGIDMTRDVRERFDMFLGPNRVNVARLALNMDQIEEHEPPPNPAKMSDSRAQAQGYVDLHGDESWELDAIPPNVLAEIIQREIIQLRDDELWKVALEREDIAKAHLAQVSESWPAVTKLVDRINRRKKRE